MTERTRTTTAGYRAERVNPVEPLIPADMCGELRTRCASTEVAGAGRADYCLVSRTGSGVMTVIVALRRARNPSSS